MIDGVLTFEDGEVRLAGDIVPGVLVSQSVGGMVRFDEAEQDGQSGTVKTPMGWEDADVSLVLDLLTDDTGDCYDKLTALNLIFRGADNGANPKIYTVTGRHVRARGIDQVVFSGLNSSESDQDDVIQVSLSFAEHLPPIVRQETQVSAADQATGSVPTVAVAEPDNDPELMDDPAFLAGFKQGVS